MTRYVRPIAPAISIRRQKLPAGRSLRFSLILLALALAPNGFAADPPQSLEFPTIKGHGGVFRVPGSPEMPRQDSKVVVDVTTGAEDGGVNKGLDRAARFTNLLTLGGASHFQMAVILHGAATKEALSGEAYAALFGKPNPNADLVRQLRGAGVRILVCGQALMHAGYRPEQTAPEVEVALSAATAIIDRQMRGFAYLAIQ